MVFCIDNGKRPNYDVKRHNMDRQPVPSAKSNKIVKFRTPVKPTKVQNYYQLSYNTNDTRWVYFKIFKIVVIKA